MVLVDAVVLHVDEQAVDEADPERRFSQARAEAAEAEFAVGREAFDFKELSGPCIVKVRNRGAGDGACR